MENEHPAAEDTSAAPSEEGHAENRRSAPKSSDEPTAAKNPRKKKKRKRGRWFLFSIVVLVVLLAGIRAVMPTAVKWYVNRTLDRDRRYDGLVGDIDIDLWRGAYTIHDVKIVKTTGAVPVPLFAAERMDLAVEWDALMEGKVVGRIAIERPELNFVDASDDSESQTGAGGPWLEMIQDLFPFKINSLVVRDGSIHFRAFDTDPQVNVFLIDLQGSIENLTNIHDDVTPMIATVAAEGLAMGHAPLTYQMKFDPFSYRPTFQTAVKLVGLDVTETNALARAYGQFDFESGWFDLVVELDAREGQLEGYVKPLFRELKIFSFKKIPQKDPLEVFWEALLGIASEVFKNQPRDQVGTVIPLQGDLTDPQTDLLQILGNVLRNAFIRAYLPRLEGVAPAAGGIEFGTGTIPGVETPGQP